MKSITKSVSLIVILTLLGCKNPSPNPALAFIDLLRGELLLCGDGQFGELKFSLACSYEK